MGFRQCRNRGWQSRPRHKSAQVASGARGVVYHKSGEGSTGRLWLLRPCPGPAGLQADTSKLSLRLWGSIRGHLGQIPLQEVRS